MIDGTNQEKEYRGWNDNLFVLLIGGMQITRLFFLLVVIGLCGLSEQSSTTKRMTTIKVTTGMDVHRSDKMGTHALDSYETSLFLIYETTDGLPTLQLALLPQVLRTLVLCLMLSQFVLVVESRAFQHPMMCYVVLFIWGLLWGWLLLYQVTCVSPIGDTTYLSFGWSSSSLLARNVFSIHAKGARVGSSFLANDHEW